MTELKQSLVNEAKRIEEDSTYSSNSHFIASNRWNGYNLWLGIPSSVIATIAGASILSQISEYEIISGILSLFVAALTAISTFLNPSGTASAHQSAGTKYRALRNRARMFREIDCQTDASLDLLVKMVKELAEERDDLNENSPQIPRWAYLASKKGIERGEAEYEIDITASPR